MQRSQIPARHGGCLLDRHIGSEKRLLRITADYREGASGLVDLLNSAQVLWYIPVVFFQSKEDTREILMMIGRQDEAYIDVVPLRGGYRPKRLKSK